VSSSRKFNEGRNIPAMNLGFKQIPLFFEPLNPGLNLGHRGNDVGREVDGSF
jgi:hypothetical protein